ncbi:hypothetical protein AACH06_01410 [Ideonella sp. DXS29W]|uniref:Uncharacterized protein n=1 Tax=Ideonella lacteola TaxID=2984193 RepID=A0ABU9BI97_9BURK
MLELAAALLALMGVAHAYLGERYILSRLARREAQLPPLLGGTAFTLGTLRFVWHLIAVPWGTMAYLLLVLAHSDPSRDQLLTAIGASASLSALMPFWFTRGRHLSWLVFLLIGGLVLGA